MAFFLNQKSDEIFTKFMNGEKLSGIKDSLTGKRFTDDYLLQKLCDKIKESNKEEESEWLKTVYNNTSGYIHLK